MTHSPENPTTPEPVALKPCPFCRGEAALFSHADYGWGPSWHVECTDPDGGDEGCGCGTCHHESKAEAIVAWNTRPTPDLAERIEGLERALNHIRYEAEREGGRLVHLKRCIAVQTRDALAILVALKEENSHD